jgi:hypothetical protein
MIFSRFEPSQKDDIPYILTFCKSTPYHLDETNNLFVHGGFNRHERLEEQETYYGGIEICNVHTYGIKAAMALDIQIKWLRLQ